jgi:hypothetical protein
MATLYEITKELKQVAQWIDDGEAVPDADQTGTMLATLDALGEVLHDKVENVAAIIRNTDVTIEAMKDAEATLKARRTTLERKRDWLNSYLLTGMQQAGIDKIECKFFRVALKTNPPKVVIDADAKLPFDYMRIPEMKPEPDKKKLLDDLKQGVVIDGARLEQSQRVEIK